MLGAEFPSTPQEEKGFFAGCLKNSFFLQPYLRNLLHSDFGLKVRALIKLLYKNIIGIWGIKPVFEELKFVLPYVVFDFSSVCVPCLFELMRNNSSWLKVYGINETEPHKRLNCFFSFCNCHYNKCCLYCKIFQG